jgi:hypothetical protein
MRASSRSANDRDSFVRNCAVRASNAIATIAHSGAWNAGSE